MMIQPIIIPQCDNKTRTIVESDDDRVYLEGDYLRCVGFMICDWKGDKDDAEDWKVERRTFDYDICIKREGIFEVGCFYGWENELYTVQIYTLEKDPISFDFHEKEDAQRFHAAIIAWWLPKK